MIGPRSIGRKTGSWLGAIASAVLLAALVMLIGKSLSPHVGRAKTTVSRTAGGPGDLIARTEPTPQAQITVVRTDSDGELECTMLPFRGEGGDGPTLYHWTGPSLQSTRCRVVPAAGRIGLGL